MSALRKKTDSGGSDSGVTVVAKKPKKKHKLPPAKKKKLWKAAGAVICLIVAVVFIYSGRDLPAVLRLCGTKKSRIKLRVGFRRGGKRDIAVGSPHRQRLRICYQG